MTDANYIRWFRELGVGDVALVGGKTASLGELYSALAAEGVKVPDGFAITAEAYRDALTAAGAWKPLHDLLDGLGKSDVDRLAQSAAAARQDRLRRDRRRGARPADHRRLPRSEERLRRRSVARRPQLGHRRGPADRELRRPARELSERARRNRRWSRPAGAASPRIFTDRAIVYRIDNGFDHFKVALSVAVMKMVRSDVGASGVIFTLDTETGFRDVVFVTGGYGLGENIVQGRIDPDEFYVHKPTYRKGFRAVLRRRLGDKQLRMVYAAAAGDAATTRNTPTSKAERERFCLSDDEVLTLAGYAIAIEDHYSLEGRPAHADGHRMGEGRRGRRALHRPGAAGDRRLAADARHDLRPTRSRDRAPSWSPGARSARRSPAAWRA